MPALNVYTDGGWWEQQQTSAAVFNIIDSTDWFWLTSCVNGGTSQRAELTGAILALEFLDQHPHRFSSITILSDSNYLVKSMNGEWRRKTNLDLWGVLDRLRSDVTFRWIKSHSGIPGNELANALCQVARETWTQQPTLRRYRGEVLKWSDGQFALDFTSTQA